MSSDDAIILQCWWAVLIGSYSAKHTEAVVLWYPQHLCSRGLSFEDNAVVFLLFSLWDSKGLQAQHCTITPCGRECPELKQIHNEWNLSRLSLAAAVFHNTPAV